VGSDSKNGVRHQQALSPRLSMMMMIFIDVISVNNKIRFVDCLLWIVRDGDTVKHYRIRQLDEGGFFIARRVTFRTLAELVEHYGRDPDGLCVNLKKPCLLVSRSSALSFQGWKTLGGGLKAQSGEVFLVFSFFG